MKDYRYIGWKIIAILALGLAFFLMVQLGTGAGDPVRDIQNVQAICQNGQVIASVQSGQPYYSCQLLVVEDQL